MKKTPQELIIADCVVTLLQSAVPCEKDLKYALDIFIKYKKAKKASIIYELLEKKYFDQSPSKVDIFSWSKEFVEAVNIDFVDEDNNPTTFNIWTDKEKVIDKIKSIDDPEELTQKLQELNDYKLEARKLLDSMNGLMSLLTAFEGTKKPFLLPPLTGDNMKNFKRIIARIKSENKK